MENRLTRVSGLPSVKILNCANDACEKAARYYARGREDDWSFQSTARQDLKPFLEAKTLFGSRQKGFCARPGQPVGVGKIVLQEESRGTFPFQSVTLRAVTL